MSSQRIGILGGAFDPVHLGHLILAGDAHEALALDRLIFMPGAWTPLKGRPPVASDEQRLSMLADATQKHPTWEVSDWEIRRGGVSYSIHTATHLKERFPEAELFWIIGADQLARLPHWHLIGDLGHLVRFAVAVREGDTAHRPESLPENVRIERLPARRIDIASTEIRERLAVGRTGPELLLPEGVLKFIREKGLYRGDTFA